MKFGRLCFVVGSICCFLNHGLGFCITREQHNEVNCQNPTELVSTHSNNQTVTKDNHEIPTTESIEFDNSIPSLTNKNALKDKDVKWGTVIYYELAEDLRLNLNVSETISKAIHQLEHVTCIEFKPKLDEADKDYMYFTYESDGRTSHNVGKNIIYLTDNCNDEGIVLHEIMHALGFAHEHQRPDRDSYVEIKKENIDPSYLDDFNVTPKNNTFSLSLPYDFYSITHFSATKYSKNDEPTIKPKINGVTFQEECHRRLSILDVFKINLAYDCFVKDPQKFDPKRVYFAE